MPVLFQILCARCRSVFHICPSCFRNHKYCGDPCRDKARREQKKAANKRHRESVEGRLDNRDRVREHRAKLRAKAARVMDHTLELVSTNDKVASDGQTPKKVIGTVIVASLVAVFDNLSEGVEDVDFSYPTPTCCVCGVQSPLVFPDAPDLWRSKRPGRSP